MTRSIVHSWPPARLSVIVSRTHGVHAAKSGRPLAVLGVFSSVCKFAKSSVQWCKMTHNGNQRYPKPLTYRLCRIAYGLIMQLFEATYIHDSMVVRAKYRARFQNMSFGVVGTLM
eukprot:4210731-Pleurochrysis_carterae.AAC.1